MRGRHWPAVTAGASTRGRHGHKRVQATRASKHGSKPSKRAASKLHPPSVAHALVKGEDGSGALEVVAAQLQLLQRVHCGLEHRRQGRRSACSKGASH